MAQLKEEVFVMLKKKGFSKKEIDSLRKVKAKKFYFVEPKKRFQYQGNKYQLDDRGLDYGYVKVSSIKNVSDE